MTGIILKWKDGEKQAGATIPIYEKKRKTYFKLKQVRRHKERHAILTKGNN